jgi:hypothetical protein
MQQYTEQRKKKNDSTYSEVCDLTKTINDMAKNAVIETLKECECQTILFDEYDPLWGVDENGEEVQITSIRLNEEGEVEYCGHDEVANHIEGIIESGDAVRIEWADVLFAVNSVYDLETEEKE